MFFIVSIFLMYHHTCIITYTMMYYNISWVIITTVIICNELNIPVSHLWFLKFSQNWKKAKLVLNTLKIYNFLIITLAWWLYLTYWFIVSLLVWILAIYLYLLKGVQPEMKSLTIITRHHVFPKKKELVIFIFFLSLRQFWFIGKYGEPFSCTFM